MQQETSDEVNQLRENCRLLEEQVKVLVRTELQLRRMKAELMQSQSIINEYNRNLEKIIQERTGELLESNKMLQQEMKVRKKKEHELRVLEETIIRSERMDAASILAGSVAHELNNLLTGIIGYPNLLLRKLDTDNPHVNYLKAIKASGEKAAAVVKDLVILSRSGIVSGERINLNDIIKMFMDSPEYLHLSHEYTEKFIVTSLDKSLYDTFGSIINVYNAIVNCIRVALIFRRSKGQIRLATINKTINSAEKRYEQIPPGKYVVIIIDDNGEKIDKSHYNRLFEPFYLRKTMGKPCTGMELSVVWSVVKDHHGYVDISYDSRHGNRYVLYFPVKENKIKHTRKKYPSVDYTGNNESILIVDDGEIQRDICTKYLQELGYRPVAVASGEEAIEYLKREKADLLLIDMIMDPGLNGFETYRKILQIHPHQKAVITSGNVDSLLVEKTLSLGARMFVKKPFSYEEIGRAVKTGLSE